MSKFEIFFNLNSKYFQFQFMFILFHYNYYDYRFNKRPRILTIAAASWTANIKNLKSDRASCTTEKRHFVTNLINFTGTLRGSTKITAIFMARWNSGCTTITSSTTVTFSPTASTKCWNSLWPSRRKCESIWCWTSFLKRFQFNSMTIFTLF